LIETFKVGEKRFMMKARKIWKFLDKIDRSIDRYRATGNFDLQYAGEEEEFLDKIDDLLYLIERLPDSDEKRELIGKIEEIIEFV